MTLTCNTLSIRTKNCLYILKKSGKSKLLLSFSLSFIKRVLNFKHLQHCMSIAFISTLFYFSIRRVEKLVSWSFDHVLISAIAPALLQQNATSGLLLSQISLAWILFIDNHDAGLPSATKTLNIIGASLFHLEYCPIVQLYLEDVQHIRTTIFVFLCLISETSLKSLRCQGYNRSIIY